MSLFKAWYLLIPISAIGAALFVARRRAEQPRERETLQPLPPVALCPMDPARWAELAANLDCSPDELTDYSRRITLFMVRELRWGATLVVERWHGQSLTLMFDRFQPITGIDFPPAPSLPEPR